MNEEDKVTYEDIQLLIAALSSCAIEGNEWAAELLKLKKDNPEAFYKRIIQEKLI
jgi:thiaminase